MTDEQLAAVEARANAATPGPWHDYRSSKSIRPPHSLLQKCVIARYPTRTTKYPISHEEWEGNAAFIAHARSDVPALIAEIRELKAALRLARDNLSAGAPYEVLMQVHNAIDD